MRKPKIGSRISCNIGNKEIDDAKLQSEKGMIFICQNIVEGSECLNKLGYKYSWAIGEGKLDDELIEYHNMKLKFLTQSQRLNL